MANYCGKCGSEIQSNLEICPYCGDELKNQLLSNAYAQERPIPLEISDFAPVEITDSGKKTFYCMIAIIICPIIVINGSVFSFASTSGYPELSLMIFLYVDLPLIAIFTPLLYYFYKLYTSTSTITISIIGIEFIQFPKRHPFQVNWSDFDTVNFRVSGTRAIPDSTLTSTRPLIRTLKIKFLRDHPTPYRAGIKHKIFSDGKAQVILNQIIYYAKKMNKTIITNRRTRRYYSLQI